MNPARVADPPPRFVTPNFAWLGACNEASLSGGAMHVHYSCFVILGEKETALVDVSIPSYWPTLDRQLDEVLAGRQLDWIFLTHPENPHAASLPLLLEKYPGSRAVGDMRDMHLFHPRYADRLVHKEIGESIDLGGGSGLVFTDAPFKDLVNSLWAYEPKERIMFVSDGFAYSHHAVDPEGEELIHAPGECRLLSSELPGVVKPEHATFQLRSALSWMRHADIPELFARTAKILDEHPSTFIAPSHGNVIDNVDVILPVMEEAYR